MYKAIISSLVAIVALLALLVTQYEDSGPALGSAQSGLPAGLASTSKIVVIVGTVSEPVATTSCVSRVVGTASTSAMVGIGSMLPSASLGYFVAASTTQEFDSGIYGCGALKMFPFGSGVITVTDNLQ